ncbi:hypothetical protein BU056_08410 [Staphylococcus succinus]|nr:hypothetical protein BU056_08410 [Staphylococcus succinus]
MKRKAERIIAWIANGLSLIYLLFLVIGLFLINNPQFVEMYNEMNQQNGVEISSEAFKATAMFQGGILLISTIIGIIATILINKHNVLSACLFIVAGLIGIFTANIIALVLWLVVAIMLFSRKNDKKHDKHNALKPNQQNEFSQKQQHAEVNPDTEMKKKKDNDPYIY